MLDKEQTTPAVQHAGHSGTLYGPLPILFLAVALLSFCLSEAEALHALWFVPHRPLSILKQINPPLSMLVPLGIGFAFYGIIARMSKAGELSLHAAAKLKYYLAFLMGVFYVAILGLATLAFP